jgi:hypothetical protein
MAFAAVISLLQILDESGRSVEAEWKQYELRIYEA